MKTVTTSNCYSVSRCAEDVEFDIEINPYHSETISFTKQDLVDMLALYEDDPIKELETQVEEMREELIGYE